MLKTMSIIELFQVGKSFEAVINEGTKDEIDAIAENYCKIVLSDSTISKIKNIQEDINFLIAGEVWCPDFQLNATALKKICDLNKKFNISIISFFRGKKFLASLLDIDEDMFCCPTIVVLDKNFNIIGKFEEMPQDILLNSNFEEIEDDYFNGKYLLDTVDELVNILTIN